MRSGKIKVLVVDDSAFMRLLLSDILSKSPDIDIVGTANDGKEAVEKTKSLNPNVVLLDMNMGEYDGLYAVERIMTETPRPILILSAVGNTNLQPIFEALKLGAVDYMNKPSRSSSKLRVIEGDLIGKIKDIARSSPKTVPVARKVDEDALRVEESIHFDIACIGASTGGPAAVEEIVSHLPASTGVPIVICQHMPENFIKPFVDRLNGLSELNVLVGEKGMVPRPGQAIVAPGNSNMVLKEDKETGAKMIGFSQKVFREYNNPSINALFTSIAEIYRKKALGILLTGMGKDGANGLLAIREKGGFTIAQNQESSIIFGMPKVAIDKGAASKVLGIKEMASFLLRKL